MIQLHVITKNAEQIKEIVKLLINEKLIIGATVVNTVSNYQGEKDEIKTVLTNMLIGRTKAALFNTIEKLLQDKYGESIPAIYAMPIVGMDTKHTEKLNLRIKEA